MVPRSVRGIASHLVGKSGGILTRIAALIRTRLSTFCAAPLLSRDRQGALIYLPSGRVQSPGAGPSATIGRTTAGTDLVQPLNHNENLMRPLLRVLPPFRCCRIEKLAKQPIRRGGRNQRFGNERLNDAGTLKFGDALQFLVRESPKKTKDRGPGCRGRVAKERNYEVRAQMRAGGDSGQIKLRNSAIDYTSIIPHGTPEAQYGFAPDRV